jgi:hypothetical protein
MDRKKFQIVLEENALVYMMSTTKDSMLTLSFKLGSMGSSNALHYKEAIFLIIWVV